jgi:uncharacterized membrane protein (DUF106 family)
MSDNTKNLENTKSLMNELHAELHAMWELGTITNMARLQENQRLIIAAVSKMMDIVETLQERRGDDDITH